MAITERMNRLIEENASLNARLASRLKRLHLEFLVWASPLSCRSPEETKIWHPHYERKPSFVKVIIYFSLLWIYSVVGIARFFAYRGFYYNYVKKQSPVLLVIPDEITDHSSTIRTAYLTEDDHRPIDKVAFSRFKNLELRFSNLSYIAKIKFFLRLLQAVCSDIVEMMSHRKVTFLYFDSLMIFLQWLISQTWYFHWDFYHFLKMIVASRRPKYKVLFCVHEMHFYSKIMWQVAREERLQGVTAQHAMIIPEKLWYFPQLSELNAHCPTPDIFFVYSDEIKELLHPFYPETQFPLCCSPRFKKWKTNNVHTFHKSVSGDKSFILFVGGIMPYDVTVLIQGIRSLLGKRGCAKDIIVRLRLHPYASIYVKDKVWIWFASKKRLIKTSDATLEDDLLQARLVIGSNSTVLQEAALLGKPVLSIYSSDYVHPSILPNTNEWNASVNDLSVERIKRQMEKMPDSELINRFRKNMGVSNPDLTTSLIYETCNLL